MIIMGEILENKSNLEIYGSELLHSNPSIKRSRRHGMIDNFHKFDVKCINEIINEIINECKLFEEDAYHYKIYSRVHQKGYGMKWHVDDAIVNTSSKTVFNIDIEDFITSKKYFHYPDAVRPKYSLLIYLSSQGTDFVGGELELVDGTIFTPQKGMYVLFDSREVHKVNQVTSGTRKSILIKFY